MVITPKQVKNLSYVIVDDLYSAEEVEQIKGELRGLIPFWRDAVNTGTATDDGGQLKKNAMGLFLDEHYKDRSKSPILNLNRRLFCEEIVHEATKASQYFYGLRTCNYDTTLANYYSNGGDYKPHRDNSLLTAVTYFCLGNISGGGLVFSEQDEIVPFRENRTVIFPGCAVHAAENVIAGEGSFRVSIVQFLNYRY